MLRSLFAVLAVLVVGLAFLFGRPWLYIATGAILAGALGLLGWWVWTTYLAEKPERPRPQPAPDASGSSIDEFGIVDIQPEGTEPSAPSSDEDASPEASAAPEKSAPEKPSPEKSSPTPSGPRSSGPNSSPATRPPPTARDTSDNRPDSSEGPEETAVFPPLLEALRAALDARTVALLVQEEVALTYRIEALASTHDAVRQSGAFDTQAPLVTATMSRKSVTLRPLAETQVAVEDLGYYASPPAVDHLAVAPVPQPDSSATTFLLADAPAAADLGTARARTLLKHFSDTIALLYDTDRRPPADDASPEGTSSDGTSSSANDPSSNDPSSNGPGAPSDTPRPRRELIAEEMSAAQSTDDDLSLALVHLNRAESIARRGEEAVASAERLFQARLDQMAPGQRIERFGELTYGVFFHEGTETVEPWVADLESTMAQEQGELEGGVSVGVAVWDEETPEALRSEATKALRKAYETGTSTIVT